MQATRTQDRRKLREAVNALTDLEVARIVTQYYATANVARLDALAREMIEAADRLVSPR